MGAKDQDALLMNVVSSGTLLWVIPKSELGTRKKGESHKKLVELLRYARDEERLDDLAGRVVLNFQGFDDDPRAIPEIKECRKWLEAVSNDVSYLFYVLEPRSSLPLLMLCYVPFRKDGTAVLPDQHRAMGFLLDCGASAYELARLDGYENPKDTAAQFLARAGLGHEVNDDLLADFERTFEEEHDSA